MQDLARDNEEYRDNPNVMAQNLSGFTVPDWMMEKVKIQMAALRTDFNKGKSRSATPVESQPEEPQVYCQNSFYQGHLKSIVKREYIAHDLF